MAIPSPWPVTKLTIYSTPLTCAVTFFIGDGMESVKLGFLTKFHSQLVGLAAWQVPKSHQGTYQRFHRSMIFQL